MGAIEGVAVYQPEMHRLVVPMVVAILIGLFLIQSRGTERVATFFGPIMLAYFATIAVLGVISICIPRDHRAQPASCGDDVRGRPFRGFLAMGAAVLAVTGGGALCRHGPFRPQPDPGVVAGLRAAGAGAELSGPGLAADARSSALESPFYFLAPEWFQWPLLVIASLAAVIASQAVISGAFSVTQQAIQLGFIPRMTIKHTSTAAGQIYIPVINWALMVAVILLVLVFQRSSNLTAAYGIAVTGAMLIDNVLLAVVLFKLWNWKPVWRSACCRCSS
jgi:KUP system potassium uptake protein